MPAPAAPRHCALVAARATADALRRGRRAADDYLLRQAVAERARNARPQSVPAAERFAALRERIAAREAASAACPAALDG